ncbi:MAG: dihydroorotate dehydrogenase electron transfer subunit [Massilibacteroides sp.]|nr:dihydroorotate dehydrogenase electron transfer subunit [Massilibacteroides sp.]MDD3061389.1 dihydroorotate dehydrogenase electron transfer subunit [Massilibacteroides sp.]MDD4115141.1 dihydroorotate dehydrogenase electron transfer subunit [Massilibacteroides sp.]MDD4659480.1 dihydroorotate dehydrogenase electron transfer subunit [Massilibacteroides sp.]
MKKYIMDMKVTENLRLNQNYCLLKLSPETLLPDMLPGQFVEVKVDNATTFLRRPISINYIDRSKNELWLLVQIVGDGTRTMAELKTGDWVNIILPLGNSFTIPEKNAEAKLLLIGGGVGTAPMLYLGDYLKKKGFTPSFLLGARSAMDMLQLDDFKNLGTVYITTEDGSLGEKGYVTQHSILKNKRFDRIYTCGPKPMMVAVAKVAHEASIDCEASLENTMACGIGACLCCVEKTTEGHQCVCTEGPIFNIKKLTWLN